MSPFIRHSRPLVMLFGLLTISCASAGNQQEAVVEQAPLSLSESVLIANGNDLERLFDAWITPYADKSLDALNGKHIKFIPDTSMKKGRSSANSKAVADGFSRFCSFNGGRLVHEEGEIGDNYRCEKQDSTYIGSMSAVRTAIGSEILLQVSYETPQMYQERNKELQKLDQRKSRNGPTGWVVTDEGKFRFLRLGGAKSRQLIELSIPQNNSNAKTEYIPIEDVASLTFKGVNLDAKLRNGRDLKINLARLFQRTPTALMAYGLDYPLPIVILDSKSGKPYINLYPSAKGIRSIEFDPVEKWTNLPNDAIQITMTSQKYEVDLKRLHNEFIHFNEICNASTEEIEMLSACRNARFADDRKERIIKLQAEFEGREYMSKYRRDLGR